MFSSRLRQTAGRNQLARALDARRAACLPVVDLTLSNPTTAGFVYPSEILQSLSQERARCYDPLPFGLPSARQAVSDDFTRRGVDAPADRILLTSSSSESYSLLFKLLCDPGDVVLAPRPSYPLIEHLSDLDAVVLEQYPLDFHGRWSIDVDRLRDRLLRPGKGRVRAIMMVSPNNPTGSVITPTELDAIAALAREHDLALVSDEVFADYPMAGDAITSALSQDTALTFALGGLSKSAGLPQVKLGWIGVGGPESLVAGAMGRLETMCDAYLSVSTPVQVAAPDLLKAGAHVRGQILERTRANYATLVAAAAACPSCSVLPVEAGWYAVVQVPAVRSEEALVLELLERTGCVVHPGYFFDFEREAFLVVSLLPDTEAFGLAMQALFFEIGELR